MLPSATNAVGGLIETVGTPFALLVTGPKVPAELTLPAKSLQVTA